MQYGIHPQPILLNNGKRVHRVINESTVIEKGDYVLWGSPPTLALIRTMRIGATPSESTYELCLTTAKLTSIEKDIPHSHLVAYTETWIGAHKGRISTPPWTPQTINPKRGHYAGDIVAGLNGEYYIITQFFETELLNEYFSALSINHYSPRINLYQPSQMASYNPPTWVGQKVYWLNGLIHEVTDIYGDALRLRASNGVGFNVSKTIWEEFHQECKVGPMSLLTPPSSGLPQFSTPKKVISDYGINSFVYLVTWATIGGPDLQSLHPNKESVPGFRSRWKDHSKYGMIQGIWVLVEPQVGHIVSESSDGGVFIEGRLTPAYPSLTDISIYLPIVRQ